MPEKLPPGERPEILVRGKVPPEKMRELQTRLGERFGQKHLLEMSEEVLAKIKEGEVEKTSFEKSAIRLLNELTNKTLEGFGLTPFDIPEQNIHFLPKSVYRQVEPKPDRVASASLRHQAIFVNADNPRTNLLVFITDILHEMRHLKGYVAVEMTEGTEPLNKGAQYEAGGYRYGLVTYTTFRRAQERESREKYPSFEGLNEAVVNDTDLSLIEEVLEKSNDPDAKKALETMRSNEFRSYKEKVVKKTNLADNDIFWVDPETRTYYPVGYLGQKRVLDFIIKTVTEDNLSGLPKTDEEIVKKGKEIRTLFHKAHFTGNILTIAKIIEKSFGKKSFRVIGTMGTDPDSANRVMDYLQKQRRLVVRKG